ncbi:MFS transporter [Rhizobium alvei]|uniref:MFS transporter n=1 Tax=Rhizobium alvei TaxID=1132659 RepID=A0ABT8YH89_9HYPH|nr:MFS transporter [Rhizobium alvei]MDO6962946.1 MFS transporter [Rhizobium alvei]
MLAAIRIILHNPAIRVATIALFSTGLTYGATLPYLSIVAIKEFGMSNVMLSLLLFVIALANLVYGVSIALVSDAIRNVKPMILFVNLAGIIGFGLVYLLPHMAVFVFAAVLLVPLSNASFALLFSSIRAFSSPLGNREASAVTQVVRALYSGSWILVPGLIALWLANSNSLLPAWGFSAVACLASFTIVWLLMPSLERSQDAPRSPFFASLRELTAANMIGLVVSMSLITAAPRLLSVIQPLIMTGLAGGKITDVGFVAGFTAGLEIPFMLMWGMCLQRLTVLQVLGIGTVIYAVFLALISQASTPIEIYLLTIPNACGVSAILSLPLSYYHELSPERPGFGTSLNQITSFVSTGMSALAFSIGAATLGYSGSNWIGVVMVILGIAGLFALDHRSKGKRP